MGRHDRLFIAAFLAVLLAACVLGRTSAQAAEAKPSKSDAKAEEVKKSETKRAHEFWDADKQGRFITAMCRGLDGSIWVGTEGNGVWRYDSEEKNQRKAWTQFSRASTGGKPEVCGPALTAGTENENALGDDFAYALACDQLGRIWVGHVNHGVSVYNGREWRNYDVLRGPLGERVFDIAVCPVDGDVWIATSAGLARYSLVSDTWSYYTRSDGLVSDQVEALAFDKLGHLYAGTQCDGLTKALRSPLGEYLRWQHIPGAETMPNTPTGKGLPSRLINDILVASDGAVYVATTCGLARSRDSGRTWEYTRGVDWEERVKGLYCPTKPFWNTSEESIFLKEDYITCLEEAADGRIWVGFWTQGWMVFDPRLGPQTFAPNPRSPKSAKNSWRELVVASSPAMEKDRHFVNAIEPSNALAGTYGEGIEQIEVDAPSTKRPRATAIELAPIGTITIPRLPSPAKSMALQALETLRQEIGQRGERGRISRVQEKAVYCGDDWMTQGDWVGRYGRKHAILCAAGAPWDHELSFGLPAYRASASIGPHHNANEALRNWCWAVRSDERRVLYDPKLALRRPSGWDDHAEAYPWTYEGPDVWVFTEVGEGIFGISLYFVNYDGQKSNNRFRDYLIEVREGGDSQMRTPVLAAARVREWWSGVYKRFVVRGPGKYAIRIGRNGSFNTMVMGVMLDKLEGPKDPIADTELVWTGNLRYGPPEVKQLPSPVFPQSLYESLDKDADLSRCLATLLCRSVHQEKGADAISARLRWKLRAWTTEDRKTFDETMAEAWRRMQELNPALKSRKWRKYSPGTE